MKKIFTFFAAALMCANMSAEPLQQDLPLTTESWWFWDSKYNIVNDKLVAEFEANWGGVGTSLDGADWSNWSKLVVVVDNIEGCDGQYWYVKAELRDQNFDPDRQDNIVMKAELGKENDPSQTNYLVIDFSVIPEGFHFDQLKQLVLQSEVPGTITVSRVFLEDPEEEGIEQINAAAIHGGSSKLLLDGQLYILRDNHIFNAQGARVK